MLDVMLNKPEIELVKKNIWGRIWLNYTLIHFLLIDPYIHYQSPKLLLCNTCLWSLNTGFKKLFLGIKSSYLPLPSYLTASLLIQNVSDYNTICFFILCNGKQVMKL